MSYKAQAEEWVAALHTAFARNPEIARVAIANYAPTWIEIGAQMDLVYAENERLKAIADLIELKNENDRLKQELEYYTSSGPHTISIDGTISHEGSPFWQNCKPEDDAK